MKITNWRAGKAIVSMLCTAALAISFLPPVAFAAVTAKTTDYLNMRSGAGTNYDVLVTLPAGTSVSVLDNSDPNWAKVKTASGKQGYCSKEYLQVNTDSSANNGTSSASGSTAVVTDSVNVRKGIGTSYQLLAKLGVGATVTILDASSHATWVKIRTVSGIEGYCLKECLKMNDQASGTPSPANQNTPSSSGTVGSTASVKANLNMRKGMGLNYGIITTLAEGVSVTVLDNTDSVWAKVRTTSGLEGYCMKEYLSIGGSSSGTQAPSNTPAPSSASGISAETTDYLNLRKGAGPSYPVIKVLAIGTKLTIIDNTHATWAKVQLQDGTVGCCVKEFLKISSAQPSQSTTDNSPSTPNTTSTDNTSTAGHTIVGAIVTADALRVRSGPGTNNNVVTTVMKNAALTVLDTSNSEWTKIQTASNLAGYVSTQYIKFRYSDDTADTASDLTLSNSSATVSVGKTLYIKAKMNPSTAAVSWASNNTSVATVSNGYVYATAPGMAVITASSGSASASCTVTVSEAEPVKTAYASPNIAGPGETITLTAVTDLSRDGVKFVIDKNDGTTQTVDASSPTTESVLNTYTKVWKATVNFNNAGTYRVTALSSLNGSYSSTGFSTSAYVVSTNDYTATTNEERRISDKMITLISNWEGYRSTVYADQLTSTGVPTIGYGYTFKEGTAFYNDMTKTEAWSLLVNTINTAAYTTEVNKFIKNHNLLMNQNQFDALVSFGYNVGAGYWNGSSEIDLTRIMLNAVDPSGISGETAATVSKDTVVRDSPAITGNQIQEISKGTAITVTSTSFVSPKDGWYSVRLSDGSCGWINSGYVTLSNTFSLTHNLNYTNAYAFGTDMLRWNMAGSKSYAGLLYRRLGEANVYNYNDYSASRTNTYGYTYPAALANLDVR